MQPVAGGDLNFADLADRNAVEHLVGHGDESSPDFNQQPGLENSRQLALCAGFGLTHLLAEDDDCILWEEPLVSLLRVGEVHSFEHLNSGVVCAKQPLRFEGITHTRIDAMDFTPGLRDDNGRSILFREPEILIGKLVRLLT